MLERPLVAGMGVGGLGGSAGETLDAAALRAVPEGRLVAWSGSLGDEPFDAHPLTWGPRGWAALHAACDRLSPVLIDSGRTLLIRTHARHVLSDPRACLKFAAERGAGSPFALLPDVAAMIEPSMVATIDDHLDRLFAALPAIAGEAGAVLAGVPARATVAQPGPDQTEGDAAASPALLPVPIHRGAVPAAALIARWRLRMPYGTQMVLVGEEIDEQVAALAARAANH